MIKAPDALAAVRLLACDVDGILTDGGLHYGATGESGKTFHVRDGYGIRRLQEAGIEVALITARMSPALERRAAELGIARVLVGREDKGVALAEVLAATGIPAREAAYVGDDLIDLPALRLAGVAITVSDAVPEVRAIAHWVTIAAGGRGAVREIADAIIAAREARAPRFRVVIPARMGSQRLPGKPLREIAGRPMIAYVWERAVAAGADEVVVACDDTRIVDVITALGGHARLTSPDHPSGTDRIAEVAAALGWSDDDIVVNLQGDEPAMPADAIQRVAGLLHRTVGAGVATLATPIKTVADLFDPNVVKVVLDDAGLAHYFSRAPVPWARDAFGSGALPSRLPDGVRFLRHLGLYAYRVAVLQRLCATPPSPLERAESLEQLRALSRGLAIVVGILDTAPAHGVDTEDDLARIHDELARRGPA